MFTFSVSNCGSALRRLARDGTVQTNKTGRLIDEKFTETHVRHWQVVERNSPLQDDDRARHSRQFPRGRGLHDADRAHQDGPVRRSPVTIQSDLDVRGVVYCDSGLRVRLSDCVALPDLEGCLRDANSIVAPDFSGAAVAVGKAWPTPAARNRDAGYRQRH